MTKTLSSHSSPSSHTGVPANSTRPDADFSAPVEITSAQGDDFPSADDFKDSALLPSDYRRKKIMHWTAKDYAPLITGHAAAKLADSGVAPLVAFARNYQVINEENHRELFTLGGLSNPRSSAFKLLKKATTGEGEDGEERDGLVMPWFAASDIAAGVNHPERDLNEVSPQTVQYRPSEPYENNKGKPVKYVFVKGADMLLDVHPSTPADWIHDAPKLMFCEGLLKGDSALSSWLVHMGVPREDLAGDFEDPRGVLADIMDDLPLNQRLLILRSPSVTTFEKNPRSWTSLELKGREAWVAIDADVRENGMVWRAANKLRNALLDSRVTKVKHLSPMVDGDSKAGIDDYLSEHGDWESLMLFLDNELPRLEVDPNERPAGSWRISKDGVSTQISKPKIDDQGNFIGGVNWFDGDFKMGGRILSMENSRQPTDEEIRTGELDDDPGHGERSVEIEISWKEDGAELDAVVRGPESLLMQLPDTWESKGGHIPAKLARHWQWPPRGKDGEKFLEAIKLHRSDAIIDRTRWMRMGWVPTPGSPIPSFIAGNLVIAESAEAEESIISGVNADLLHGFDSFGVGGVESLRKEIDFDNPEYRAQVKKDLDDVMDLYIHSGAWARRQDASILLATALRPVVPVRPKSSVYIQGPKGKGKSMSAQYVMLFWAANCGDWQDNLPGSADDTEASTENSVAHAPIWVVDDLAPSTSSRQAQLAESRIENLVRSIFNRSSRGRMTANMTTRRSNPPIAQLVVTAENELNTPSARERLIPVHIGTGALHASREVTNAIASRAKSDGLQARLTRHLLGWVLHEANGMGWYEFFKAIEDTILDDKDRCANEMKELGAKESEVERASVLASDLAIPSFLLKGMAQHVGAYRDVRYFASDMRKDILTNVFLAHGENRELSPGRSLMRALGQLLASGRAHIGNAEDPSKPPYAMTEESGDNESGSDQQVNSRLGWVPGGQDGQLKPSGIRIGTLVTIKKERVILFDETNAFQEAQRFYPDTILPGQKKTAGWSGVWDEGLASKNSKRQKVNTVQKQIGLVSHRGVPVDLSSMLDLGSSED